MRLFIALPLPPEACRQLLETMENWKREGVRGTWTKKHNLHLTLAFLGEQPESILPALKECLKQVPFEPVELSIEKSGSFGSLVYAALASGEGLENLERYVRVLRRTLRQAGISFDSKPFRAHITMVRRMQNPHGIPLSVEVPSFECRECCLYASELTEKGPVYTVIESTGSDEAVC